MKIKNIYFILNLVLFMMLSFNVSFADEFDKVYNVGYHADERPMQFLDDDKNASGISIEIMRYISEKIGVEMKFIPITHTTSDKDLEALDFSISIANNTILENIFTRASESYFDLDLYLIGPSKGVEDAGRKVGIIDYCNVNRVDVFDAVPNASIQYFDNNSDLQKTLYTGGISFAFMNKIVAQDFLTLDEDNAFEIYPVAIKLPFNILISSSVSVGIEESINEALLSIEDEFLADVVLNNTPDILLVNNFMDYRDSSDYIEVARNATIIVLVVTCLLVVLYQLYRNHLNRMTFYDKVTGFLTEYKFNIEVSKVLKKAKPDEYSLISVDIDNFQYVNEVYSFDTGTEILKQFAEYLKVYYSNGKHFTRLHSDNFLILVKNEEVTEDDEEKNEFSDENFDKVLGNYCHFYTSKGVYNIDDPSLTLTTLVGCVNLARVSGKTTYGNTSIVFTKQMNKKHLAQNKILSTMEKALKEKEFEVFYQPKISLEKQTLCGAEALVRWIVRDGDPIYPDEFIPLFEKNRYITKLDFYVFEEVCHFISTHREELKDIVLSVNLSTITLLQNDLAENLTEIMKKYDIDVNSIELEVTESAFVDNLEQVLLQIQLLKNIGFSIALDDFGSGISSLNQLKNIDLDVLKLDKAFLSNSLNQDKGLLIVENIILLAQKLKLTIVAEGVETEEDVSLLSKLGCDIAQGYYFARPMPQNNFLQFVVKPIKG